MAARVVLAMSGGVDSSVAAYLLRQQGYEVIGLFMRTGVHEAPLTPTPLPQGGEGRANSTSLLNRGERRPDPPPLPQGGEGQGVRGERKKGCCSAVDAGDARRVADRLDIPFYALDFEGEFNRIIDYFADEYLAGRTPNPCVVCNNWLKFGQLWSYAQQLDADFVATGHYAQVVRTDAGVELHRAADPDKDQSYVLYGLRREVLPHLLFPIGGYRKDEVRALAREAGLGVADKPDSVEICFVPDGDHASLIRQRRPQHATVGHIVDTSGKVLAEHDGIEQFTIGQRKGLGFAAGERRYVLKIVPGDNDVVVGPHEDLLASGLAATSVNWLLDGPPHGELTCQAKIRYRHTAAPARVRLLAEDRAEVEFETPQSAITPGQAVVFYQGSRVLGGGWIETALPSPVQS